MTLIESILIFAVMFPIIACLGAIIRGHEIDKMFIIEVLILAILGLVSSIFDWDIL